VTAYKELSYQADAEAGRKYASGDRSTIH
jgi:hypothetical protein